MKIKGIPVGTTMPRADLEQSDPKKASYVRGRKSFFDEIISKVKSGLESLNVGTGNTISLKGYYFTDINFDTNEITLSKDRNPPEEVFYVDWPTGTKISIKNKEWYGYCATIKNVKHNVIAVDSLPFTSISTGSDEDDRSVVAPELPSMGEVEFAKYSSSFGYNNKINAKGSVAIGANNTIGASAGSSFVFGKESESTASTATAIGYRAKATADNAIATGQSTTASGQASMSSGYLTKASGKFSRAAGNETTASGQNSDASGFKTTASGLHSHATGNNTKATNTGAAAHNYNTTASGENSFAIGSTNTASGNKSFASGTSTKATKDNAATFGSGTTASNVQATAFGVNTIASGKNSIAGGNKSEASGEASFAMGYAAKANGSNTVALGYVVEATPKNAKIQSQTVVGQYNKGAGSDDENAVFVAGNGTSSDNKSTAFRVMEDGTADVCNNKIANVANGTQNGDAVNYAQLSGHHNTAKKYTDDELKKHKDATNPHGITPDAIGAPVDVALGTGQDLNKVVKSGMYRIGESVVNGLTEFNYGQLLVIRGGGDDYDTITQIAFSFSSSRMWLRSGNGEDVGGGGAWTEWVEVTRDQTGMGCERDTGKFDGYVIQYNEYPKWSAAKFYHVFVQYTALQNNDTAERYDVFVVDRVLLDTNGITFTRCNKDGAEYSVTVSIDTNKHPQFTSSNCGMKRIIGYY